MKELQILQCHFPVPSCLWAILAFHFVSRTMHVARHTVLSPAKLVEWFLCLSSLFIVITRRKGSEMEMLSFLFFICRAQWTFCCSKLFEQKWKGLPLLKSTWTPGLYWLNIMDLHKRLCLVEHILTSWEIAYFGLQKWSSQIFIFGLLWGKRT